MADKQFFRSLPRKGFPLYWILLAYLAVGYFYPVIGFLAIICMIAPVAFAVRKGRWWCGNACPRGNFYDNVLARFSPHRPIPPFVRTKAFRIFMVMFIFTMFGVQMYRAWGGTWCSFCPMGTLSSWVTPAGGKLPDGYRRIFVGERCTTRCKQCSAVCPMQLKPYESRNDAAGYLHPDCLKCGRCVSGCPLKVPELKS